MSLSGQKFVGRPMGPAGLKDTSRDRTGEFKSTVESISQRRHHATSYSSHRRGDQVDANQASNPFAQASVQIGRDLGITNLKLGKLTLLVRREGPPGDHSIEIQQLRGIIKQDIGALNRQLGQMQELMKSGRYHCVSQQQHSHLGTIVVTLQSKLASISTGFKTALELEQKLQMTAPHSYQQQPPRSNGNLNPPHPHTASASSHGDGNVSIDMGGYNPPSDGIRNGEVVQNRFSNSNQQQQMFVVEEAEVRQRDNSMQSIEQTIVDLGEIFSQLSYMMKEQEEMTNRIDHNVDTTSLNIEGAHTQLVKYLKAVSSTRSFMIKVFAVLIVFFILVVFFFT